MSIDKNIDNHDTFKNQPAQNAKFHFLPSKTTDESLFVTVGNESR